MRRALVFGGSGAVGSEVVRALAAADVPATFTWHRSRERAGALAEATGARAVQIDLADADAVRALIGGLPEQPDVFVHCAAVSRAAPIYEVTSEEWERTLAVNGRSAFLAVQALAPSMASAKRGDVVLVGALDRAQSLPMPVPFAASQGMLSAMTMALAKELGKDGIRVNLVALGVLDGGLSRDIRPDQLADFKSFSALKRTGTAAEAARAIAWLALENTYMSGKVLPVNGGI